MNEARVDVVSTCIALSVAKKGRIDCYFVVVVVLFVVAITIKEWCTRESIEVS